MRSERGPLARMQHSNISALLDWGATADGDGWLAMEYVEGQPIDVYCRAHQSAAEAILRLFEQVTAAVEYAHNRGVIHRDLKPANILVREDGVVKLLDFGIAQTAGASADPAVGRWLTPAYSSPEQLRGERAAEASDVYSLGVVLHQLLTGQLPSPAGRPARGAAPVKLRRELEAILSRAMAAEAGQRYPNVAALRLDLDHYRRRLPPRGVASTRRQQTRWFCERHRQRERPGQKVARR